MIKSMTGYGRVEALCEARQIVVEAKSVNHRFLEISLRVPPALYPLEMEYRKKISERFKRGRIDVSIRIEGEGLDNGKIHLNLDVARGYFDALDRLREAFHIEEPIRLKNLICFRDIFSSPAETQLSESLIAELERALVETLSILAGMRQEEGIALYSDMKMRLDLLGELVKNIQSRAPQVVLEYQKRLSDRVKEFIPGIEVDPVRLAQEIAIMADRCDITEEIVRMQSHISQFEALLQSDEAEGRKIDFLLQEMNRELNTIGSKSNDVEIARQVIEAKSELGKLREQAQNIE